MYIDYDLLFADNWRIGSGEGAGHYLDAMVRRDANGLPFVPGSTLRGLTRDAIRTLAKGLSVATCEGTLTRSKTGELGTLCGINRQGSCPLCSLAGSPHREGQVLWGPARVVLSNAQDETLRGQERDHLAWVAGRIPEFLTRIHPHTSIDAQSGRAQEQRLFSLEEVHAGLQLAGRLEITPGLRRRDVALLVAALRWIREVGGSRRRGLGTCRIRITTSDLSPCFRCWEDAVRHLPEIAKGGSAASTSSSITAPVTNPQASASTSTATHTSGGTQGLPQFLQLTATVVGEVALGGRPEVGNLIPGMPYVPGSTLRGALAPRWRGDRKGEDFQKSFLSGKVRFGFLYPMENNEETALPLPHSVYTCKLHPGTLSGSGHGLVDLLLHPTADRCERQQSGCNGRLIPWGPRFGRRIVREGRLWLSPHNRINPDQQTVGEGGLFAYQSLGEGSQLRGFLRADQPQDLATLLQGLDLALDVPFRIRVGRRKGALGCLECTLSTVGLKASGVGLFPDCAPVPDNWPQTGTLRIDLLTPTIVIDEHLRYRSSLLPSDLGLDRSAFDGVFATSQVVSGWNNTHRLPKADQLAVTAGSSYLLKAVETHELERLQDRAMHGVGLRRVEGFGVISVSRCEAVA